MQLMFANANSFNGDLSNWNVSKVVNMKFMFFSANSFNGDLSNWNVSNVRSMYHMFYDAINFNQHLHWKVAWKINDACCTENFFKNSKISKKYDNLSNPFEENDTHSYYDKFRRESVIVAIKSILEKQIKIFELRELSDQIVNFV